MKKLTMEKIKEIKDLKKLCPFENETVEKRKSLWEDLCKNYILNEEFVKKYIINGHYYFESYESLFKYPLSED